MHIPTIVRREEPGTEAYENSSCSGSLSWFRWCPVDIVLWALILVAISLCCWKLYTTTRTARGERTSLRQANDSRYKRLMLPYRADPSPAYRDEFESEHLYDVEKKTSTRVDPYHVVKNINDSLISKDARFNGASVPQAVLDQKKSGRVSGMGLGLGLNILERTSPTPEQFVETSEHKHGRLFSQVTPPPPPAYVHNARWDHV